MNFDDEYEQRGFLQKYGFALGIGAAGLVVVGLVVGQMLTGKKEAPRRQQEVVMIRPLPTPPTPPQPKPPEPPKQTEEKMMEQAPVDDSEAKPDDSPKESSAGITTNLTGTGGPDFGLKAARRGGDLLGGEGNSNGPRSRFGWYAARVQKTIQDALSRNGKTSRADFGNKVRVWADISGRITRAKLEGTTGDKTVDQAINEALTGLQLPDPPPADMPMPIVMRLTARRPG